MSELGIEKNSVTNKSNTDISAYHAPQCEQLANDLYRLSVFYPHTKNYVNTYLIHTPERSLLIDTGSRDDESFFSLSTYYFTYQGKRRHWEDYPVAFHWTLMVEMAAYLRHLLTKNEVKLHQTTSGCIFTLADVF